MRLIDADELKHELKWLEEYDPPVYHDVASTVDEMPTVDAELVVRCKDCKFNLNSNEKCGLVDTRLHFYETDKVWTGDCFCSWGERREDGKTDLRKGIDEAD